MKTTEKRMLYLDNLRAFLVILVIVHHIAITYGAPGSWFYVEEVEENLLALIPLTLLATVNQSFFMGLLFLIAGYFTPGSYYRKGASTFLKDRFIRLGVPIVFYIIFFNPFLRYQYLIRETKLDSTYIDFWLKCLTNLEYIGIGPLWFVEALLIFSVGYVLWRRFTPQAEEQSSLEGLSNKKILVFALALTIITGITRLWISIGEEFFFLQLGFFPQYIAFFIIGIISYRRGWLNGKPSSVVDLWRKIVVAAILLWPVLLIAGGALSGDTEPFQGGPHWQAFAYATWEMFLGVAMSIYLLDLFERRLNTTGQLWRSLSNSAYTMYIIHPMIVVALTLILADIVVFPLLKFALIVPLAIAIIFIISYFIRQLPYAKKVL